MSVLQLKQNYKQELKTKMLTAFQYFEYFWFTISHYFSKYIIGRISIRTLISEQVASYKYLFVHELSDNQSGLNPLVNSVSYIAPCLIPNLYIIMIILFTNYIISHYRQCGGEGRGYVCIFVLYYCRILRSSKMIFLLALMKAYIICL